MSCPIPNAHPTHAELVRLSYALEKDAGLLEDLVGAKDTRRFLASGHCGKIRFLSNLCSSSPTRIRDLISLLPSGATIRPIESGEVTTCTTQTTPVSEFSPTATTNYVAVPRSSEGTSYTAPRLPSIPTSTRLPQARPVNSR